MRGDLMTRLILVVDDDKQLRHLYRMVLEREGFRVEEAANGAEAIKFLVSHTPDVVVMDMLMPMLGGEAVMSRIQQMPALRDMRIVVLTAYPRFRESALFLDADAFLVKPATPDQLLETVKNVLSGTAVDSPPATGNGPPAAPGNDDEN